MAPATSAPFGDIKVSLASYSLPSIAPNEIFNGNPTESLPTSPSSTIPSKIILLRSATVEIVVPGLNVFASIT